MRMKGDGQRHAGMTNRCDHVSLNRFKEVRMQKKKCSLSRKSLIGTLIIATTLAMSFPQNGRAMLVPTQGVSDGHQLHDTRAADLKTIQTALESKIIRQRLTELKLSPDQMV